MQPIDTNVYNFYQLNSNLISAYLKYQEIVKVFLSLCTNSHFSSPGILLQELYQVMIPVMQFWSNPGILMPLMQQMTSTYLANNMMNNFNETYDSKKFNSQEWEANPFFAFMKDYYLKQTALMQDIVSSADITDVKQKKKLEFYTKKVSEALSPANFAFSNPEVIKETIETQGENFIKGMDNLLKDLQDAQNTGQFGISTTAQNAFTVGENLAITPGKVVFQNDLMQLIQYSPSTARIYKLPILIIPAWINKFYILDLQPSNSYVKWIVEQGNTVFMVSWVNPDKSLANKTFENYLMEGAITAINKVKELSQEEKIHCIGYCLGGTLLSIALAYLAAKNIDSVHSATFLTTLIDFTECGDVGVFIDEPELEFIERLMAKDGFLDGYYLRQTFSILRAEDMIWSFFINNYLLGKTPKPFDILSWNADSTRLPAAMHSYYLRKLYQENALIKPNELKFDGVGIDLSNIKIPTYILATKDDHIAPWVSAYKATSFYQGPKRFVLSGSGHVAGVVNHPSKNKYCYWINEKLQEKHEAWLENATEIAGSWWNDWLPWVQKQINCTMPARNINKKFVIENAPGSYVKIK